MLDGEPFDDGAERPPLEAGRAKCADEVADLAQGAFQQAHRLPRALLRGWVGRERSLEHLELGQCREDVLYRPIVHV